MKRPSMRKLVSSTLALAFVACAGTAWSQAPSGEERIEPTRWKFVKQESGPVNYYSVVEEAGLSFIRAQYKPGYDTAVYGYPFPEADRGRVRKIRWSWRAMTLPNGGDECADGKEDSAAVVYVTWKRGLRWYSIKYVWSGVGTKGRTCGRKRSPFVAQDTVIVDSGAPLNTWKTVEIDVKAEFRAHFEDNDQNADVPDLLGIAIMTDGDQTKSESAADYGAFVITR